MLVLSLAARSDNCSFARASAAYIVSVVRKSNNYGVISLFFIAGIDEAGRGPLAGPVTAACVILGNNTIVPGLDDSKKIRERERNKLYQEITSRAVAYSIVSLGPKRIDELNIRAATQFAMKLAAESVQRKVGEGSVVHFLIDGNMGIESPLSHEAIIKGDSKLSCISAASILAKVSRDRLMMSLSSHFPNYGLEAHKGYPTKSHRAQISALGPSLSHRKTFRGVREFIS